MPCSSVVYYNTQVESPLEGWGLIFGEGTGLLSATASKNSNITLQSKTSGSRPPPSGASGNSMSSIRGTPRDDNMLGSILGSPVYANCHSTAQPEPSCLPLSN